IRQRVGSCERFASRRHCSIEIDWNTEPGVILVAVVVRPIVPVAETQCVLSAEVEALLSVEVQPVGVSHGVFVVAEALTLVDAALRGGETIASPIVEWRSNRREARIALRLVRNRERTKRSSGRCIVQVVVAPTEGRVKQPRRTQGCIIA